MIGPASRRHFYKALAHAGRAEAHVWSDRVSPVEREIALAQIEALRGMAFAFLEGDVTVRDPGPSERKDES